MTAPSGLIAVVLACGLTSAWAQFGMGGPPKKTFAPVKADAGKIGCDVCEAMVRESWAQASAMHVAAEPAKLEEEKVHELLEKICNPKSSEGKWIAKMDLVSSKDVAAGDENIVGNTGNLKPGKEYLLLRQHASFGHCERECETIAKACHDLADEELDMDTLAVALWNRQQEPDALVDQLCSDACPRKPMSKKRKDYEFREKSDQEVKMDELMATLEASGMGGMNMYSRDDMQGMMDEYGDALGEL